MASDLVFSQVKTSADAKLKHPNRVTQQGPKWAQKWLDFSIG